MLNQFIIARKIRCYYWHAHTHGVYDSHACPFRLIDMIEHAFDNYDSELKKFSEEFEKQMKANAAKENSETQEVATEPVA